MIFNLTLVRNKYRFPDSNGGLCVNQLAYLFDLHDMPLSIVIKITASQNKNSYLVNKYYYNGNPENGLFGVDITLTDNSIYRCATDFDTDCKLSFLPESFYISVIA